MTNTASMQKTDQIKEQASEWLVRLSLEDADDAVRTDFERWRQADPRHAEAYARFEEIWQASTAFDDLLEPIESELSGVSHGVFGRWLASCRQTLLRPALAFPVAAILLLAVVVSTLWQQPAVQVFKTDIAEIRTITLQDGSQITLGAYSEINVDYSRTQRYVALLSGEAFFSVEKNPEVPFVVDAGGAFVRVLGTQFNVRRAPQDIKVAVLEGNVEVKPTQAINGAKAKQVVTAGQQVVATIQGGIQAPQAIKSAEPGAWRKGRLVYVDAPLLDVVQDANRYTQIPIELAEPSLQTLQVSATFRTDQIDRMLETLSQVFSLEAHYRADKVLLRAKPEEGAQ